MTKRSDLRRLKSGAVVSLVEFSIDRIWPNEIFKLI